MAGGDHREWENRHFLFHDELSALIFQNPADGGAASLDGSFSSPLASFADCRSDYRDSGAENAGHPSALHRDQEAYQLFAVIKHLDIITLDSWIGGRFRALGMTVLWSLAWGAATVLLVVWIVRTLNWAWREPRRLERALRAQGLDGSPYRFPFGDVKENNRLLQEVRAKPMPLHSHDIIPRLLPVFHRHYRQYGKLRVFL
ncbi:hypothetical protein ZIOFF_025254 [Zingiber officinale]|uniref:Uncharacterized protein n=1 Tax=Zingiber officinale TaxID=94328 RepID=A0A8J5LE71_ZINOF|nr:hypothetical protein ZIOFF_025254 [Zingiber officinale]